MFVKMNRQTIKRGRGAQYNPKNRFEIFYLEDFKEDELDYFAEEAGEKKIPTQFFHDDSKTVIAKNDSYDVGFEYSFNPYRGCEHGCIYCYARPTHEFLGFSAGIDFESKIMIKEKAPQLLEAEFNRSNYKPDFIMFSGNTDCYQPVERKLKITREALKVCLKYRNPVSIISKNELIKRDIDILQDMAELNLVSVCISITSLDKQLAGKMEPRTSSPERRLQTIKKFAEKKIPVGVNIAPVIPGLNDEEIPSIIKEASARGAIFAGRIMLRLPYAVKELFLGWLKKEFPDRENKIVNKIKEMRNGRLNDYEFGTRFSGKGELAETIHSLFELSCKKYGLNTERIELRKDLFRKPTNQLEIF
jgi:DNA repair photolyase